MSTPLDRSWVRRGAFGYGWLGRALTPLWEEATVQFRRATLLDDGKGGFIREETPQTYWTTTAHVDMTEPSNDIALVSGTMQRHIIRLFVRPPSDPALMPKKGDEFVWADPAGFRHDLRIHAVIFPAGHDNHLEIESEAFS